jgi:hypothetical protein
MNWEAIGAIAELVGAGAVVLTLIYLSIQLRQNTAQVTHSAMTTEIAAYQDMIGRISELNALRVTNPELTDLILRGEKDLDVLTENERSRYFTWIVTLLRHGDMAYFLFEREIIDYERATSSMGPLIGAFQTESFHHVWSVMKERRIFTSEYVSFIETLREQRDA